MGKKTANTAEKRPPGRPSAGPNTLIACRVPDPLLAKLDKWRSSQKPPLNQSAAVTEAIRRLVE